MRFSRKQHFVRKQLLPHTASIDSSDFQDVEVVVVKSCSMVRKEVC